MPSYGQPISALQRTHGLETFDALRRSAVSSILEAPEGALENAHLIKPKLVALPSEQVDSIGAFNRSMHANWDDHNCFYRAQFTSRFANELGGEGTNPADDTFNGAIAILKPDSPGANWYFHTGTVLNDATRGLVVMDGLARRPVVPFDEWAQTFGSTAERVDVRSPFAGSGLSFGWDAAGTPNPPITRTTAGDWNLAYDNLAKTWNEIPTSAGDSA